MNLKSSGKRPQAFTLIELLVVIAIIGLLATLSVLALNNARMKARDTKRLADVKQIQTAMELYYNTTGHYPTVGEFNSRKFEHYSPSVGTSTYMVEIPTAPTPPDGSCSSADNTYTYVPNAELSDYELTFCVAKPSSDLPDGNLIGFSGGIKGGTGGGEPVVCDPVCGYGYTCQSGSCILKDNFFFSSVYGSIDSQQDKELTDVAFDSQYLYAVGSNNVEGAGQLDGMIIKYDKSNLAITAKRVYGGGGKEYLYSIVEEGSYIYTAGIVNYGASSNASLTKYNKSDLSLVSALNLGNAGNSAYSLVKDGNYLYIGVDNTVMVYDFDFNLIRQNSYTNSITSIAIDSNYLYLVSSLGNKIITLKVDKSTMAVENKNAYGRTGITFFPTFRTSVDDNYYYVYGQIIGEGPASRNAFIFKYNKTDLSLLNKKIYGGSSMDYLSSLCLNGEFLYGVGYSGSSGVGSGDVWLMKINRSDLSLVNSEVITEKNPDSWGYEDTFCSSCLYEGGNLYFTAIFDEYDDGSNSLFSNSAALVKIKSDFVSSDTTSGNSIFTISPYSPTVVDSNLDISDPTVSSQVGSKPSSILNFSSIESNGLNIYGPYIIE